MTRQRRWSENLLAFVFWMMCAVKRLGAAVVPCAVSITPLVAQERTWLCDETALTAWPASEPAIEMKQPAELPGVGELYVRRLNSG